MKGVENSSELAIAMKYLESTSTWLAIPQIPIAVSTCLGLLNTGEGRYRALPWSMIVANRTSYEKQQAVTVSEVSRYLRPRFDISLEKIYQKARSSVFKTLNEVCGRCVRRGNYP